MKKLISIIMCICILISVTACSKEAKSTEHKAQSEEEEAQSTEQKAQGEEEATPAETEAPAIKNGARTADVGYYHEETRCSLVEGVEYINLFGTRIYYTTPNELTYVPLEGSAYDWSVRADRYGITDEWYIENDRLYIKTNSTGYIYFINSATNEEATLYVNEAVKKINKRKQKDESLPYYLYLEKGSYSDFKKGTIALTVYRVDDSGYYTIPYLTICTACGSMSSKTPVGYHTIGGSDTGSFSMNGREYWHDWGGGQYGQYAISYSSGVYLHGPTGDGKYESQCIAGSYNQVGTHASGGCLRMQVGSIYWIWTNCPNGTTLEIVDGNPRGTCIEKAATIEGYNYIYDPTDPYLLTKQHNE